MTATSVDNGPAAGYSGAVSDPPSTPPPPPRLDALTAASADALRAAKADAIRAALARHGGNRTRAAEELGYANAAKLRRAAARAGVDLAEIPAPTPQEYGGLRRNGAVAQTKR